MPVLEILRYPNPILRQPAQVLTAAEILSDDIQGLVRDMVETMYGFPGTVGLAAPQVGRSVQIFVMDADAKSASREHLEVVINPQIVQQSQWKYSREGCLSFPEYLVTVKRARKMTATWYDATGQQKEGELRDFEAIIFQHELDHLQGILFIDRVRNMQTDLMIRETQTPV